MSETTKVALTDTNYSATNCDGEATDLLARKHYPGLVLPSKFLLYGVAKSTKRETRITAINTVMGHSPFPRFIGIPLVDTAFCGFGLSITARLISGLTSGPVDKSIGRRTASSLLLAFRLSTPPPCGRSKSAPLRFSATAILTVCACL